MPGVHTGRLIVPSSRLLMRKIRDVLRRSAAGIVQMRDLRQPWVLALQPVSNGRPRRNDRLLFEPSFSILSSS